MKQNRLKQVLAAGGIPVGHMISEFATRGIAKILEPTGIDFAILDMEHTGHDAGRVADVMAWFQAVTVAPIVRVPQPYYHFMARSLDAGALGVMAPNVETPAEANAVADAVKYAPLGHRGVGLGAAHTGYVVPPDPAAYFEQANDNTVVICQIESINGLDNLDGIASTAGVDVLWVGHYDLTVSMGIPGEFDNPVFLDAMRRVAEAAHGHGKAVGAQPGNLKQAEQWLALGFNAISWGSDAGVYQRCLRAEVAALRERFPQTA